MVIGVYVGAATVGGAAYWFMYDPTGPQMSFYQLSHHMQCYGSPEEFKGISCEIFQVRLSLIRIRIDSALMDPDTIAMKLKK